MHRTNVVAALAAVVILALPVVVPAQSGAPTIAVLPFLTQRGQTDARAQELSAQIIGGHAASALKKSGRFGGVIDRSADDAVRQELSNAGDAAAFGGRVQLSREVRLLGQYVLIGLIDDQRVDRKQQKDNSYNYEARLTLNLKVADVQTGEFVDGGSVRISNSAMPTAKDFQKCKAGDACKSMRERLGGILGGIMKQAISADKTEEAALQRARDNAEVAILNFANQLTISGLGATGGIAAAPGDAKPSAAAAAEAPIPVLNMKPATGAITELLLRASGVDVGARLSIDEMVTSPLDTTQRYAEPLGDLEVVKVETGLVRAKPLGSAEQVSQMRRAILGKRAVVTRKK